MKKPSYKKLGQREIRRFPKVHPEEITGKYF